MSWLNPWKFVKNTTAGLQDIEQTRMCDAEANAKDPHPKQYVPLPLGGGQNKKLQISSTYQIPP